jgi:signal transduction histidine kinase
MEPLDCADQFSKEIVITTSQVGERAVIEISNNGPAVHDDVINKLFEPLFSSSKSSVQMGMGLAIVKSIVDSHSDIIQAFSVNQQVTFRMAFPLYVQ